MARQRRARTTVLTGPELVRIATKNLARNRRRRVEGKLDFPTLPTLADITANENRVIIVQDTEEEA